MRLHVGDANPSPATARIAALRPVHLSRAAEIHADSFGEEAWSESVLNEVLAMPGSFGRVVLMDQDGRDRVHGFALIRVAADEAELLTLCTAPACRRTGVATALLTDFLVQSSERGAATAYLEVAEDNDGAFALYQRFGFTVVGFRANYYRRGSNPRVGAQLLRRSLPPASP